LRFDVSSIVVLVSLALAQPGRAVQHVLPRRFRWRRHSNSTPVAQRGRSRCTSGTAWFSSIATRSSTDVPAVMAAGIPGLAGVRFSRRM